MIIEKARQALEKLRETNYKQIPDFGMDEETEIILNALSNECKSTILSENEDGTLNARRHESDIVKNNVEKIVRQLVLNGNRIPKEVMNKICYSNDRFLGVNSDIEIYKGIREGQDGSMEHIATIGNSIIDIKTLDGDTTNLIQQEIYRRYARQILLENKDKLPKQNPITLFKEQILHKRENKDYLRKKYIEILKQKTQYGKDIIGNTVDYNLEYLYNDKFKTEILNSINTGNSLIPLDNEKKKNSFNMLLEIISAETGDLANIIPNINQIHSDIEQIYADIETQLEAYSTDITQLNAKQIEQTIKNINSISLKNSEKRKYLGENGYRNVNVGISGNEIKLLEQSKVQEAMGKLSEDIYNLVKNGSKMNNDEYIKQATKLQYRFIRIHPFPDSNGRTSRALLNMITIPKGILVQFPKELKTEYNKVSNQTHNKVDEKGYLNAIEQGTANTMEQNIELPLEEFIEQNCIINTNKRIEDNSQSQNKELSYDREK